RARAPPAGGPGSGRPRRTRRRSSRGPDRAGLAADRRRRRSPRPRAQGQGCASRPAAPRPRAAGSGLGVGGTCWLTYRVRHHGRQLQATPLRKSGSARFAVTRSASGPDAAPAAAREGGVPRARRAVRTTGVRTAARVPTESGDGRALAAPSEARSLTARVSRGALSAPEGAFEGRDGDVEVGE